MSDVTVVRWRRFGKDRLYVNGPDEQRLGWCDLLTGAVDLEDEHHRAEVEAALDAWRALEGGPKPPGDMPLPSVGAAVPAADAAEPILDSSAEPFEYERSLEHQQAAEAATTATGGGGADTVDDWEDLIGRRAGQEAREQAVALRRAAPVRTLLARVLGVHTDERAWRVGADGEEMVAAQLAKLVRHDPRWRVLHAVPVGQNGADIDHIVIGPPGVFTLNAKHHPGAKIWVAANTFKVNGYHQPYLRNSRHEAQRASRLLTAGTGVPVHAVGVVVPVGAVDVVIKTAPEGVHVVTRKGLVEWLEAQPAVCDTETVDRIFAAARRSTTWQAKS